ncbi:MAG: hypothetical protein H6975_03685 [Gammaproteobacteria bacterium]|nr:hypothetical protein [Gammaproteobacteria bacterium]
MKTYFIVLSTPEKNHSISLWIKEANRSRAQGVAMQTTAKKYRLRRPNQLRIVAIHEQLELALSRAS